MASMSLARAFAVITTTSLGVFCCLGSVWAGDFSNVKTPSLFTWMAPYDTSPVDWDFVLKDVSPQCSLRHASLVVRHGTHSPTHEQLQAARRVIASLDQLDQTAASQDRSRRHVLDRNLLLANLAGWSTALQGGQKLMPRGVYELEFLAQSYLDLLRHQRRTGGSVAFSSTQTSRTFDSAGVFRQRFRQLVDNATDNHLAVEDVVIDNDRLAFFQNCQRYVRTIADNERSRPEVASVKHSKIATALVRALNTRLLGDKAAELPSESMLTWENVSALYYLTGLEVTNYGHSALSGLFTLDDLAYLDFADDLESYWKSGPAYKLNSLSSCVLVSDILDKGLNSQLLGSIHFTQQEAFPPLFTIFNLFQDYPAVFSADATWSQIQNRNFKASVATPFAANIAFLFFDCPQNARQLAVVVNGKLGRVLMVDELETAQPWAFGCSADNICSYDSCRHFDAKTLACQVSSAVTTGHFATTFTLLLLATTFLIVLIPSSCPR